MRSFNRVLVAVALLFGLCALAHADTVDTPINPLVGGYNDGGFVSVSGPGFVLGFLNPNASIDAFPTNGQGQPINSDYYTFTDATTITDFSAVSGIDAPFAEMSVTFELLDNGVQFGACTWGRSAVGAASSCDSGTLSQQFLAGDKFSVEVVANAASNTTFNFMNNDVFTTTGFTQTTVQPPPPPVSPTPEPASLLLLGTGLVSIGGVLRKQLAAK